MNLCSLWGEEEEEKEEEEGAKEIRCPAMQGLAEHFWAWVFALNELGLDGQIRSKEWHGVIYTVKGSLWLPGLRQTVNRETC